VIIGGGKRGVVSTACYIARTFGVRSTPMFEAEALPAGHRDPAEHGEICRRQPAGAR
jgi:nucleotidyltransferase/DNA polymerase involved in DNA repair